MRAPPGLLTPSSGNVRPGIHPDAQREGGGEAPVTTVCFVRHGETDANAAGLLQGREDTDLNDRGREQSDRTARFLSRFRWDAVATSPTRRARETALIVAREAGIACVQEMPAFMAREPGAAYALVSEERARRFAGGDAPGAESRQDVAERCTRGLAELVERYAGKRIVVVSHREPLHMMLAALSGGVLGTGRSKIAIGSISLAHHRTGAWEIEWFNAVSHL